MERAILFYESFFEQKVTVKDSLYSVFDINGFRLGLFAFEKVQEAHIFGSNCLPSVSVENIDIFKKKLEGQNIILPVINIVNNWVAEFEDSEGNHIELTTPIR
jgi:predicted enzyme related to lactoylglutathione lyase